MIKLKFDEKWEKKDFLINGEIKKIDRLTKLKIEISVDYTPKKLKGNSEIIVNDSVWKIIYKPQENSNLYLFSKELILGGDKKCYFSEELKDNWELEEIKNELINISNVFNKVIGE